MTEGMPNFGEKGVRAGADVVGVVAEGVDGGIEVRVVDPVEVVLSRVVTGRLPW